MDEMKLINAINEVILSSTSNGGDFGGPYMTSQEWARDSIEKLLQVLNLNDKYHVEFIKKLKYNDAIWLDAIPQIVSNK